MARCAAGAAAIRWRVARNLNFVRPAADSTVGRQIAAAGEGGHAAIRARSEAGVESSNRLGLERGTVTANRGLEKKSHDRAPKTPVIFASLTCRAACTVPRRAKSP